MSRAWLLVVAETVALTVFFYCAQAARNLHVEIAALEFFDVDDASARFVEWRLRKLHFRPNVRKPESVEFRNAHDIAKQMTRRSRAASQG
jgi:hypothetical protein